MKRILLLERPLSLLFALVASLGSCSRGPTLDPPATASGDDAPAAVEAPDVPPEPPPAAAGRGGPPPSTRVPIPARLACDSDADCVLSTFLACCSHPACELDASAVSRAWLRDAEATCAVVECEGSGEWPPCLGGGPTPQSAGCVAGACRVTASRE